tara:strand:+ start:141 stop:983 length:843 start_codon:yes stop_codon:yes gene_type:complete
MKKIIKKTINTLLSFSINLFRKLKFSNYLLGYVYEQLSDYYKTINHKGIKLKFYCPNELNLFRLKTFSTKEPETLDWIDSFHENSIFYDIGANIGLYSCYAAKRKNCSTVAFEPSVFNLELLAKNIFINELSNKVKVFSLPLSDNNASGDFNFSSTNVGGAKSTFNKNYSIGGEKMTTKFNYKTWGINLDDCVNIFSLPQADYIKIDVDGIDHLILKGAQQTLKKTKGVLIEVSSSFLKQEEMVGEILDKNGFKLIEKKRSSIFKNKDYESIYNQIWSKN